jgi:uncharacterized membrane protein
MENTNTPVAAPQSQNTPPATPPSTTGQNDKLMAVLSYLGFLVLIPLFMDKENPTVKFHIKQGLVLLLGWVVAWIIIIVPLFGWLISWLLQIGLVILSLVGVLNAINNQQKPLPLVGHLGDKFNF